MNGKMNRRLVGSEYEQRAIRYMQENSIQVLEQNYRCRQGEVDIIGKEEDYLLFVEVKYRSSQQSGYPAEAVTATKQRTIYRVAEYYLYSHHLPENTKVRFDVVAILGNEITYIRNAFEQ